MTRSPLLCGGPLGLVGLCVVAASPVAAATISVNFTTPSGGSLASTDVAGVEAVDNWNNIVSTTNGAGSATTGSLGDDAGSTTGASITYFTNFWQTGVSSATPDQVVASGYNNTLSNAPGTISVSGLGTDYTSGGYDVILYLSGTDGMGIDTPAQFGATIGSDTQWVRAIRRNPVSATLASTTFATEDDAQASSTESNYIRFTGLTGASFSLDVLPDPDSTATWARAAVKGVQIVAVPEPGSAMLLGLGAVALLRRRR